MDIDDIVDVDLDVVDNMALDMVVDVHGDGNANVEIDVDIARV